MLTDVPNKICKDDTTLSFAINPLIRAVHMRQSPSPSGLNSGTSTPDNAASILFFESLTRLK